MAEPNLVDLLQPKDGEQFKTGKVTVHVQVLTTVTNAVRLSIFDRAGHKDGHPVRELSCSVILNPGADLTITYPVVHKGNGGKRAVRVIAWDKDTSPQVLDDFQKITRNFKVT